MKLNVLYEDNHLIAVEKPAGVLVQGDKTKDISLMDEVRGFLKNKYEKPGNVFLGLIHRLDRPVSGIVLFAKTSKGASRISEQFRNHDVEKIYHAVVKGKPQTIKGTLVDYLKKDKEKNKVFLISELKKGFLRAELFYQVIFSNEKYSLLRIELKTGRSHQIRVQLSNIGCPIVGDIKYGGKALSDKSICLSANQLSFKLATQEDRKDLKIMLPKEWKKYVKIIE
ncbi:MAG: RNA pseudouridine synthase [Patescibacteria group bacterium]